MTFGNPAFGFGFFTPVWGRWGRYAGWPPDWGGWTGSPDPLIGHTSGCVWCGERLVVVPARWREGFEKRVLDTLTRGRLFVLVTNPLWGLYSWFVNGGCPGNLTLRQTLVMGRSWWETFWIGCGWVFPRGTGGGEEETPGHGLLSRFHKKRLACHANL
jgi:hypothetical protein